MGQAATGPNHTRFESIFHFAPDAIVVCTSDGVIVACNQQVAMLFGWGGDELVGEAVEVLLPARYREGHRAHRAAFARSPRVREMGAGAQLHGLRRDGSEFPIEISLSPLPGDTGEVMAAIRDVTERVRQQERVRAMMDFTPDATIIVGESGRIRFASRQAAALFGRPPDELVGSSVDQLLPERFRTDHARHREAFFGAPRVREMGADSDLRGLRADGTEFPVEISLSPLPGEPREVMASIRDVTDRRANEDRAAAIIEFAPDATIVVDTTGRIVQANRQTETLFGHDPETLHGLRVEDLMPERFRWSHVTHRDTYFVAPRVREMGAGEELNGLRADGTEFAVEISLSPLPGPGGHVMATIRDVTERRAAREALESALVTEQHAARELRAASRLKDEFLGIIGHELRTPLAAIIGFTDLLQSGWERYEDDVRADLLARLGRNATEMGSMVERLLDMSRLQAGRVHIEPRELDVEELLAGLVDDLEGLRTHEVAVHVGLRRTIVSDESAIRHIVGNLLTNAAKFCEPGQPIELHASDDGDGVLVRVVDHGMGIPAADVPHLFEHFFQGSNNAAGGRGVGVGLNVARRYAELLGGRIWAESTEGEGATFSVWLPFEAPSAERADA